MCFGQNMRLTQTIKPCLVITYSIFNISYHTSKYIGIARAECCTQEPSTDTLKCREDITTSRKQKYKFLNTSSMVN